MIKLNQKINTGLGDYVKKSIKIISMVLVLMLIISIGTAVIISNAQDNSRKTQIILTVDKTELKTGESTVVTVKATTNYAVGTISIPVFYDKTLTDVSDCFAPLSEYANNTVTTDLTAVDTAKIYANTGVDSKKYGFVLVNYIAGAGKNVKTMLNDEAVLTFKLTAKADVKGEAVIKIITESAKTDSNSQGMLYFGAQPDGNVINALPENVKKIDTTNAVKSIKVTDGKNTIALKNDAPYKAVIDTVNGGEFDGAIYGIDTLGWNDMLEADGTIADFITTAYGDEYLEVVVGDAGVETTGTIVNVLDEDGNVVETYVFIYFGDVDMDGLVGASDAYLCEYYEMMYEGIDTLYQFMAGDLDSDTMPGASDAYVCEYYEMMYEGILTQPEIAEAVKNNIYEIF